jgi:CheY-like chemotaxis protein
MLPAAPSARAGAAIQPQARPAAASKDGEPVPVLYVEDDALVSAATVDILESAGYLTHAVPDGSRALEMLQAHPEISLMVTDIGLPGMDGHQLAAEARRRQPALKVLFLTGYDRTRALGQPQDPLTKYLGKPYQESELLETLRRLGGAR